VLTPAIEDYEALFEERVQVGISGSDKEKGIDAALQALVQPLVSTSNEGFLREGAKLAIIYVSDENDCTDHGALDGEEDAGACYDHDDLLVSIKDLIESYEEIKSGDETILVGAIVGPEVDQGCETAAPGFRYMAMAEAFGGVVGDICEEDYGEVMVELGLEVAAVRTEFELTHFAVEDTIEVLVDDIEAPEDEFHGWFYDSDTAILSFHGDEIPKRGAVIHVSYDVAG
jgi:hypothetical protein